MLLTGFSQLVPVVVEQVMVDDDVVSFAARTVTREAACLGAVRCLAASTADTGGAWLTSRLLGGRS
ncbi:hypothetical protein ACFVT2_20665 [Streptomyces sp. NPDC058000]|uniref:hypothetical protein n=1 Tax=Streptomyces sp. NPDC058000 TaxID=3346299 RepID=UPI0036EB4BEB